MPYFHGMVYRGYLIRRWPVVNEKNIEAVKCEDGETASEDVVQENEADEQINEQLNETADEKDDENQSEEIEKLNKKINSLTEEKEALSDRLLRLQAEFDNYKRRTNKERIEERKYKSENLANELLPVLDNFERALQVEVNEENKGLIDGITMVYNQFLEAFKAEEIKAIETENQPFDPNFHHAVMQVEEDGYESNVIVEELQKGYQIKDRVIRPAMVKVNK